MAHEQHKEWSFVTAGRRWQELLPLRCRKPAMPGELHNRNVDLAIESAPTKTSYRKYFSINQLAVVMTKRVGTDGRLDRVQVILNDLFAVMAGPPHVRTASCPG
jgi:hypothetical protein